MRTVRGELWSLGELRLLRWAFRNDLRRFRHFPEFVNRAQKLCARFDAYLADAVALPRGRAFAFPRWLRNATHSLPYPTGRGWRKGERGAARA